jgi:hypothetical protein
MRRLIRSVGRVFNWDVVIRVALVPVVSYVLVGAAVGESRRAAREVAGQLAGALVPSVLGR